MRKILFRGKTKSGEWVYGGLFKADEEYYILKDADDFYDLWDLAECVIPETVGQYTGLNDKNGKKIFEGDVVLFEDESPTNYEYHDCTEMRCGVIKYGDGQFYITNRIAVEMEDLIYYDKVDCEVIGIIHDNPELLD